MYIEGRISRIFSANNGWFAGLVQRNHKNIKVSGKVNRHPYVNMWVEGEAYVTDKGYGDEWVSESYFSVRVTDRQSYMSLMCSGEFLSIDRVTADRVYNLVNGNITHLIKSLQKTPDALKSQCNLTDEQVTDFFKALVVSDQYERLLQLFPSLTKVAAKNLIEYSGMEMDLIVQYLKSNPYRLVGVKGVRFEILDKVGVVDDKISLDDVNRMYYVIFFTLKRFMKAYGCTYLNLSNPEECYYTGAYAHPYYSDGSFLQIMRKHYPLSSGFDETRLRRLFVHYQSSNFKSDKSRERMVFEHVTVAREVNGSMVSFQELRLYTGDLYYSQQELAGVFKRVCAVNDTNDSFYADGFVKLKKQLKKSHIRLSSEQLQGVKNVFRNKVSVITGGPGRGKTFILEDLIPLWETIYGFGTVMCIGPTGRSVKRMKEVAFCPESQTAARCLVSNGYYFDHFVNIPYGCDNIQSVSSFGTFRLEKKSLIIIDECSMMDFVLAGNLLKLLENSTIVFMGDVNQLQPVSPGCFFRELIDSDIVPVTRLTQNMRANHPEIVNNADAIINGTFDVFDKNNFTSNFMLMPSTSDICTQNNIYTWYQFFKKEVDSSDILVMSPVHRGPAGVEGLNIMFQNNLNPISNAVMTPMPDPNFRKLPFLQDRGRVCEHFIIRYEKDEDDKNIPCYLRIGDRLMAVENDPEIELRKYEDNDPDGCFESNINGVFNGDLGTIMRYYPSTIPGDVPYMMIQMDDGRCLYINSDDFNETKLFHLGYAFTVHKAQGSEAKHVLLSVPQNCGYNASPLNPFFTQNVVYTACTRAKESVLIIGDVDALAKAVKTPVYHHNVDLCRLLNEN